MVVVSPGLGAVAMQMLNLVRMQCFVNRQICNCKEKHEEDAMQEGGQSYERMQHNKKN